MEAQPGASERRASPPAWEQVLATGSSSEFGAALEALDFPLLVCAFEGAKLRAVLANNAASALTGYALHDLVQLDLAELIVDQEALRLAIAAWGTGRLDSISTHGPLRRRDGGLVEVVTTARRAELDGRQGVVVVMVPASEVGRLGRDRGVNGREMRPVAVGIADASWRIVSISSDVASVLGGGAADWVGTGLLDLLHSSQAVREALESGGQSTNSFPETTARRADGTWTTVALLTSSTASRDRHMFALIGERRNGLPERVGELELRLRRIGAEVRAAGVMEATNEMPSATDFPALAELTTRQWEILSRVLRGLRVPTIAAELYLSPSTVRNHLATIFRKFGVHSQPELLRVLRSAPATP